MDTRSNTRPTRRHREKQRIRAAILEAAREIFVSEGYERFNMRRLAAKIEYSTGAIYLHFSSKAEIFNCLVTESFRRLTRSLERLEAAPDADPVDTLKRSLRAYVEFGLRHPNDYRFAFIIERPDAPGSYQVDASFDIARKLVRRCMAAKRLNTDDVEMICQSLWASAHGLTSLLIQRPAFPWLRRSTLIARHIEMAVDAWLRTMSQDVPGVSDR